MNTISKVLSGTLAVIMAAGLVACSDSKDSGSSPNASAPVDESKLDYTYGEGKTFKSNEPVTYSVMYSDNEAYPYKQNWRLWSAITEKSNVNMKLTVTARTEYENQKSLLVNSGDAPYIIPKTYEEASFVAGGQIVPISDWVKYMPNYTKAVKDWGMESDLQAKLQANGKYYVLPGLWQSAGGGYSYVIRKDVFKAAGVDVEALENKWTYEDFYEALKKVKAFTGAKYVWSDQYTGKSTMNIAAISYGVTAGWGQANGLQFDQNKKEFYFANTTADYKAYVTYLNKLVKEGLLDPESFTQTDDAAKAKFYKGDTYVINGNYQFLAESKAKMQVPNADLYMTIQPGGPKGLPQIETSRLENGVMISKKALDELGQEKFIKMLRFVDWLWYSDEGQTLSLWGVEGETYTKDANGNFALTKDITYNGMNPTGTKKLNVDYGFANGVFAYGGTTKLRLSKMTEGEKNFTDRVLKNRQPRKLAPPIMASADEGEQMNLISKPLMDFISTATLKFITGQQDINSGWDAYVKQAEANGSVRYTKMANDVFAKTKSILGY